MKRPLVAAALLLAAFFAWRHFNPPLGDRELIQSHLESIRTAAQRDNPNGILSHLDENFRLSGASKSELRSHLTGFFWTYEITAVDLAGVEVAVDGETATSGGTYSIRWRSGPNAAEETRSGPFTAKWRKTDGKWKITEVTGVEGLAP
jgi:hypothetical protein